MTGEQYRNIIARLGLTQSSAARLLGVSTYSSQRWAKYGVTGFPELIWLLIDSGKITLADIQEIRERKT